jgi:hypothetical protein
VGSSGVDGWEVALAIGTVVVAVAAIAGLISESRGRRRALADDFLWRLAQHWDTADMLALRSTVARGFRVGGPPTTPTIALFNYLEFVGHFVHTGTVNPEGAWSALGDYARGYWTVGAKFVGQQRAGDTTIWAEWEQFEGLCRRMDDRSRGRSTVTGWRLRCLYLLTRVVTIASVERAFAFGSLEWSDADKANFLDNEVDMADLTKARAPRPVRVIVREMVRGRRRFGPYW